MKIVIIGGGTVGAAICAELSADKHDITVIDKSSAAVEEITSTSDVFGVVGNGADISVLRKAGTEKAQLVIAVTSGDEVNILCCAAAKRLGILPEFIAETKRSSFISAGRSIACILPERSIASTISKPLAR